MAWDQVSSMTPAQLSQIKSDFAPQYSATGGGEAGSSTYIPSQVTEGDLNYIPNSNGGYLAFKNNPAFNTEGGIEGYNGQPYTQIDAQGNVIGQGTLSGISKDSAFKKWGPFAMVAGPMALSMSGVAAAGAAAGAGGEAGAGGIAGASTAGGIDTAGNVLNGAVMNGAGDAAAAGGTAAAGAGASTAGGIDSAGNVLNSTVMNGVDAGTAAGTAGTAAGTTAATSGGSTASNILAKIAANPMSLAGPAASLVSGVLSSNAAKDAANAQLSATKTATDQQNAALDKVIALNEPFRQGGIQGLNALTTAYGLTPGTDSGWAMKDFTPSDMTTDPSYQWRLQQGQQALERSAAAKGGLLSGGFGKDLTNYAQGAASQEYGNEYQRYMQNRTAKVNQLSTLAGYGQTATGSDANSTQSTANNVSNLTTQGGNATASGIVGGANAWNNALSQGLSQYQNNELLNRLLPQR
jgi:hypothetical protein